ncbi:MAG: hypothetical protein EBY16_10425 [Gammaproteobacteria bacterium]|nr:hypothetical protein [Gammaproteobacteria bacterium]
MPWNPDAIRANIFAHYVALCKEAGWKDYAWARVKQLDEQPMFCGIKQYVLEQMKNVKSVTN